MSLAVKVRCLHHSFNMPLSSKTDCLILYMEGVKKKKKLCCDMEYVCEKYKTYSQNLQLLGVVKEII